MWTRIGIVLCAIIMIAPLAGCQGGFTRTKVETHYKKPVRGPNGRVIGYTKVHEVTRETHKGQVTDGPVRPGFASTGWDPYSGRRSKRPKSRPAPRGNTGRGGRGRR